VTQPARFRPIFHLSFPVRDLDEALRFYTSTLPGLIGRREPAWADVALFGAQITLQHVPADVLQPMPRSRHFGATLSWPDWEFLVAGLTHFVERPRVDFSGTDREQTKAMVEDPSGNLIEIKAYRNAGAVLGKIAEDAEP
jgi:extradiol dioxygenase family protein